MIGFCMLFALLWNAHNTRLEKQLLHWFLWVFAYKNASERISCSRHTPPVLLKQSQAVPPVHCQHLIEKLSNPTEPSLSHLKKKTSHTATTAPKWGAIIGVILRGRLGCGWSVIHIFLSGCLHAVQDMKQMKPGCCPDDPWCCDQMELHLQHV